MLEENLRVTREVSAASSCIPRDLIGSMLDNMSLHRPMRQIWGLVVSHPWGCLFLGAQELTSLVRRLNLVTTYSGRRRNFYIRYYKRSCEVITIICLQTLETFLSEYEYHYSLYGNNKFVHCHTTVRSSCSRLSGSQEVCVQTRAVVKLVRRSTRVVISSSYTVSSTFPCSRM